MIDGPSSKYCTEEEEGEEEERKQKTRRGRGVLSEFSSNHYLLFLICPCDVFTAFIVVLNIFLVFFLPYMLADAKELVLAPGNEGADIVFDNVSFFYDPQRPILQNVSFTVPAGSTFAIVGRSVRFNKMMMMMNE